MDLKSILEDIQKRLANLETKSVDDKQVTEQQESKNDGVSEQTIKTDTDSEIEFGKLNQAQTQGDVGQTYHQHEQYVNEKQQETLTDLEIQKEYQCIRDSVSRVQLDPCLRGYS